MVGYAIQVRTPTRGDDSVLPCLFATPGAAWTLRDVRGVLKLLALLSTLALIPALVVGPVHYRSLAKRLRGLMPEPEAGARSLWYVWPSS